MSKSRKLTLEINLSTWRSHVVWGGNSLFGNGDKAFTRRTIIFPMKNLVSSGAVKSNLPEDIKKEIPLIVYKCWDAYMKMVKRVGTAGVFASLPSSLVEAQTKLVESNNPLIRFLDSGNVFIGTGISTDAPTFITSYNAFCSSMKINAGKWTRSFYETVFQEKGIKVERKEVMDKDFKNCKITKTGYIEYYKGVSIVEPVK